MNLFVIKWDYKVVSNKKWTIFIAQYDRAFQDEWNQPFPAFLQ